MIHGVQDDAVRRHWTSFSAVPPRHPLPAARHSSQDIGALRSARRHERASPPKTFVSSTLAPSLPLSTTLLSGHECQPAEVRLLGCFRSTVALGFRQVAPGVHLPLEPGEERVPRWLGGLTGVVGGVQGVRPNPRAKTALCRRQVGSTLADGSPDAPVVDAPTVSGWSATGA